MNLYGNVTAGVGAFGVYARNGSSSTSDLTVNFVEQHLIIGGYVGIAAIQYGTGDLQVTALGTVKGATGVGIAVANLSSGHDVSVVTGEETIYGSTKAVKVYNQGSGRTDITLGGDIRGISGGPGGVFAKSFATTTGLAISSAAGHTVESGGPAIDARHYGSGNVSVEALGDVTAATGAAITVSNSSAGQNLTITTGYGAIYGDSRGILALNDGSGSTSVHVDGSVRATGTAIYAVGDSSTTGLSISTSAVSGVEGGSAIAAKHYGSGDVTVSALWNVYAGVDTGIYVYNGSLGQNMNVTTGAAAVHGATHGIFAANYGTGSTSITTGGDVTGVSNFGIYALSTASTMGLSISSVAGSAVQGQLTGIVAKRQGLGALTISALGSVTGQLLDGISAIASGYGDGVSVTTGAGLIQGVTNGINVSNTGTGDVSITAQGGVVSQLGTGVNVSNGSSGQNLSVTTGSGAITGYYRGLYVRNLGYGTTTIATGGDVTSSSLEGIYVLSGLNAAGLSITTAALHSVQSATTAIRVVKYGSGNLAITALGTTTGYSGDGINAYNGGAGVDLSVVTGGDVSGSGKGIVVSNLGIGTTSVTTSGSVVGGGGEAISAVSAASTTGLSISSAAGGNILADTIGILAKHYGSGDVTITALGQVSGQSLAGIDVYNAQGQDVSVTTGSGTVSGGFTGINVRNYGTGSTSITAGGDVLGTTAKGISATAGATASGLSITAAAGHSVAGNGIGISALNRGAGNTDVTALGAVTGQSGSGIRVYNAATAQDISVTTGSDAVYGYFRGIYVTSYGTGTTSIATGGDVTGHSNTGIYARTSANSDGLSVSSNAGHVEGLAGIMADHQGAGDLTVTALGTVSGQNYSGIRATNSSNGQDVSVTTGAGRVEGGNFGIYAINLGIGNLAITASGDVVGTGLTGIVAYGSIYGQDLSVTTLAGQVSGLYTGIKSKNYGHGATSITTGGTVTAFNGVAISVENSSAGSSLSVTTSGAVSGTTGGIRAANYGSGNVSVSALAGVTTTGLTAISVSNSSLGQDLSVTTLSGDVSGVYRGILARNYGQGATSVTTGGTVTGSNGFGIVAENTSAGSSLNVTTNGAVSGSLGGILVGGYGSGATIVATNGNVSGGAAAIHVASTNGADIAVHGHQISGGTGIVAVGQADLLLDGSGEALTVTGTGGTAVALGNAANSLAFKGDVTLNGNVAGGGGNASLAFDNATVSMGSGNAIGGFLSGGVGLTGNSTVNGFLDFGSVAVTTSTASIGALHLNGGMTAGSLTVNNGTIFAGNNTLTGNLSVASGGHVAPGNSIGTINVVGDVSFGAGAYFDVEVAGATADLLNVDGNVSIDNAAILSLSRLQTFTGSSLDILTATGTISGTFGTVKSEGVAAQVFYKSDAPGDVSLKLLEVNFSPLSAQTQSSVDTTLLFTDAALEEAVGGGGMERDADGAGVAQAEPGHGKRFWMKGLYGYDNQDKTDGYTGFDGQAGGFALGGNFDHSSHVRTGFAVGNLYSSTELSGGLGSSDAYALFALANTSYVQEMGSATGYATLGVMAGYHGIDGHRTVGVDGGTAKASMDSSNTDLGAMLQLSARLPVGAGWALFPRLGATYIHTYAGGFTEDEAGGAGISINDYDFGTVQTVQSLRLAQEDGLAIGDSAFLRPYAELGLSQLIATSDRDISGAFIMGDTGFTGQLYDGNQYFVDVSVGLDVDFTDTITGYASYERSMSEDATIENAKLGLSISF